MTPAHCDRQNVLQRRGTSSAIACKHLTPGTLRSYFRPPPSVIDRCCAWGSSARESGDPFVDPSPDRLEPRRQRHPVTGITVTSLLTSAATASAQNFFEA